MLTINFIKKVGKNFAIYEIPDNLKESYGGKYILSQGVFSEYAIKEFEDNEVINNLKEYQFEGIFQTIKEAEMTAKYADAICTLNNLIAAFDIFKSNDIESFRKISKRISEE